MSLETWAVAAVAIVDVEGSPLLLRTYTSPKDVLNSPAAPLHAHLYVGSEDVIKLHFVLLASLDRCEELREATALAKEAATAAESLSPSSSTPASTVPKRGSVTAAAGASSGTTRSNNASAMGGPGTATMIANDSLTAPAGAAAAANAARLLSPTTDARFLGKLLESHRMRSYGFCSATGIRTLLVTVGSDAPADAMVPLCRALYESASGALCNPFRSPAQSYRAQEQLLFMSALTAQSDRPGGGAGTLTTSPLDGARGSASQASPGAMTNTSLTAGSINRLHLSPGAAEWSWPRAAPTSVASLTAEPTLALSRTFNAQMESLLSSFTVTARSCIVR